MPEIPILGIGSDWLMPGLDYIEAQFGVGESTTGAPGRRVRFVMPMLSTGTWTVNKLYENPTDEEVKLGAGDGSRLHQARLISSLVNPDGHFEFVPYAVTSGGSPAAATHVTTFTFSSGTTATAQGYVDVDIDGYTPWVVPYLEGDSLTTIATAVKNSILNRTWLPVTAGNSAGVHTITDKTIGACGGNSTTGGIQVRIKARPGTNLVATMSGNALGLGAGVDGVDGDVTEATNFAAALAANVSSYGYYLCTSLWDTTNIGALGLHVDTQAEPKNGKRGIGIAAFIGAAAAANTIALAENRPRGRLIGYPDSPFSHAKLVAQVAGVLQKRQNADYTVNLNGYGKGASDWLVPPPYDSTSSLTSTVANGMLQNGVIPIMSDTGGTWMARLVTNKSKDASATYHDWRALEDHRVSGLDGFLEQLGIKLTNQFGRMKLRDDPKNADGTVDVNAVNDLPPGVTSPYVVKQAVIGLLTDWYEAGHLYELEPLIQKLVVQVSKVKSGNVQIRLPVRIIDLFVQGTTLAQEVSPG